MYCIYIYRKYFSIYYYDAFWQCTCEKCFNLVRNKFNTVLFCVIFSVNMNRLHIADLHLDLSSKMTSKNGLNIKSMKMSPVRYQIVEFLEFRFHSDPPLTSDGPRGRDLQNLLTSRDQNMWAMKISHVRY